jgi:hypothetical protein
MHKHQKMLDDPSALSVIIRIEHGESEILESALFTLNAMAMLHADTVLNIILVFPTHTLLIEYKSTYGQIPAQMVLDQLVCVKEDQLRIESSSLAGALSVGLCALSKHAVTIGQTSRQTFNRRVWMIVDSCTGLGEEYVALMNCVFAAQRQDIPIDSCWIGGDSQDMVLQQASHLTKGIYQKSSKQSLPKLFVTKFNFLFFFFNLCVYSLHFFRINRVASCCVCQFKAMWITEPLAIVIINSLKKDSFVQCVFLVNYYAQV